MYYSLEDFGAGVAAGLVAALALWAAAVWLARRRARADDVALPPAVGAPFPPAGASTEDLVPAERSAAPDPAPPIADPVRLSQRIVVHLYLQGRFQWDDVASPATTQRGIGAALSAEQSAVSKVLRRLGAAGIVEVSRRHVQGGDRRVNVYTLTRQGEMLARDLRSRAPPAEGPAPRPEIRVIPR